MTRSATRTPIVRFGLHFVIAALAATFALGTGCTLEEGGGRGNMLGRLSDSLGAMTRGDKPAPTERPAPTTEPSSLPGKEPVSEPGPVSSSCRLACSHVVACIEGACPVLEEIEDGIGGFVDECTLACEEVATDEDADAVASMSCGDIWFELVGGEPELEELCGTDTDLYSSYDEADDLDGDDFDGDCGAEDFDSYDDDYGDWDDEDGDWDDEYGDWDDEDFGM